MNRSTRIAFALATLAAATAACSSLLGDFDESATNGDGGTTPADGSSSGSGGGSGGGAGDGQSPKPDGSGSGGGSGSSSGGASGSSSGGASGSSSGGGPGDACAGGGCTDAQCPKGESPCATGCVDTTQTSTDCGQCGHDCGGGQCTNSTCHALPLVSSIDAPTSFTIDSTSIYFAVDDVLKSCPLAGCGPTPKQLASMPSMGFVQVANGAITFVGTQQVGNHPSPALYACPLAGCQTPEIMQTVGIAGGFLQTVGLGKDVYSLWEASMGTPQTSTISRCETVLTAGTGTTEPGCTSVVNIVGQEAAPIAADTTRVYFGDLQADASFEPAGIGACASGAACSSATIVATGGGGSTPIPTLMALSNGVLYFVAERDIGTGGTLYSCPVTGCASPASLDIADMHITSLAADPSGIYFTGTQGSNAGVFSCPLAGCGSVGATSIAPNQSSPSLIATDAKFIYWVDLGADGGTGGASINRIAK